MRRLEAAGYANVGKTNLHEFAYGVTSMNPHYGWVPNPVRAGRIAGGSSGGSAAALAAGLADAALGTDSGGSIRIPAAFCGIVGFKPTFGLVPLDGCWPLAPSYDHAGPMARTVADCVAMLEALVPEFEPAPQPDLGDLRVAVAWLDDADDGVRARVEEAAARSRTPSASSSRAAAATSRSSCARSRRCTRRSSPSSRRRTARTSRARSASASTSPTRSSREAERVRASYRDEAAALLEGFDLLADADAGIRGADLRGGGRRLAPLGDHELHEPVQRARLAGARAAVRDRPSTACRPRSSSSAAPARTRSSSPPEPRWRLKSTA